jgi:8-oxo-dGTP diphosphatase
VQILGAKEQGVDAIERRWLTVPRALGFVYHQENVLLMKRAPHRRIFPDRYNGVGGHIERNEDPAEAIKREIEEETGLAVRDIHLRGIHHIDAGAEAGIIMFVFTAISDTADFVDPGIEGTLHWIEKQSVLSVDLVEDLPQILPRILQMTETDMPYFAHVSYDENDQIQIRFNDQVI